MDSKLKAAHAITEESRIDYSGIDDFPLWISLYTKEIGLPGASLVIGHRQWGPQPKVFAKLDRLQIGDEVIIENRKLSLTYKVVGSEEITPDQVWQTVYRSSNAAEETDKSVIVLYTCTPYGTDLRRLLVYAELVERKRTNAPEKVKQGTCCSGHSGSQ